MALAPHLVRRHEDWFTRELFTIPFPLAIQEDELDQVKFANAADKKECALIGEFDSLITQEVE